MKTRRFQPVAIDALEDRLVMTAFAVPFTIVTPPVTEIHVKNLYLTGRTESQIKNAIANSFQTFGKQFNAAYHAYTVGLQKSGADSSALFQALQVRVNNSLTALAHSLSNVSYKLPFGHANLNPVLQDRILGTTGVTDTTTKVNTPSLQAQLAALTPSSSLSDVKAATGATKALVTSDVNNYINLGVTNNDFQLTRGATLPALS